MTTIPVNATLVNGQAIVTLASQPFHRKITNLYLQTTAPGGVNVFRASLTSQAVAGNLIGNRINLSGVIPLPAGQQLFVVWDNVPTPVSAASAQISYERDDSPLAGSGSVSVTWDVNAISSLTVPTGATTTARIVIGTDPTGTSGQILIYNNANQLVAQIDSTEIAFFGSNGSFVDLKSVGNTAQIDIEPGGGNVNAATIRGGVAASGAPQLIITSPQQTLTSPNSTAGIMLQGANAVFPESFVSIGSDALQFSGFAGTGSGAFLSMGNAQGQPPVVSLGVSGGSDIGMDGGGFSIANNVTIATTSMDLLVGTANGQGVRLGTGVLNASNGQGINGAFAGGTVAANVYADAPGTPQLTFVKDFAGTGVEIELHATCFNNTVLSTVMWGVHLNGADFDVSQFSFNNLGVHMQQSGILTIAKNAIPAGTYTVTMRWRNVGAVGTIATAAGNDWRSMRVREISG